MGVFQQPMTELNAGAEGGRMVYYVIYKSHIARLLAYIVYYYYGLERPNQAQK
jgi:hypothetical protein